MAKYFLGSVGTAEAFRKRPDGTVEKAFVSRTLTDSGLNISTTKDDIRGGTGAPIQFSFYHDPNVEITLTDVLWEKSYVEAQLGASFDNNGGKAYTTEEKVADAQGKITLDHEPMTLNMGCGAYSKFVWYKEAANADAEWEVVNDAAQEISGLTANSKYCVRYVWDNPNASIAEINSTIIPQELFLVITAPLFAGDACAASSGKKAGTITFEIPRFKLNGAQEFSMNMSSNQTMSLSGIALATESGCDITDSQLLRIIEVLDDVHWYDDVTELIADEDYLKVGDVPSIYALHKNGSISKAYNNELTFLPALNVDGEYDAAGETTITITDSPSITETVTVVQGE